MRAKKFGVPLTDSAKKEARLARFNSNNSKSADSVKTPVVSLYFKIRIWKTFLFTGCF